VLAGSRRIIDMQIRSVGIDLGKTTFHLVALSAAGKVLLRKFTQKQLITFTANMQTSSIGIEACSGAHFLGRALREQGHDVKLSPAQFVKPARTKATCHNQSDLGLFASQYAGATGFTKAASISGSEIQKCMGGVISFQ
jgi:hypothetical protein